MALAFLTLLRQEGHVVEFNLPIGDKAYVSSLGAGVARVQSPFALIPQVFTLVSLQGFAPLSPSYFT